MMAPYPATGEQMAPRARVGRDDRGRLNVFASGRVLRKGKRARLQKRVIIPGDDEKLAEDVARELNREFATGDLSFFGEPKDEPEATPAPAVGGLAFSEYARIWIEAYRPPSVSKGCFNNYRKHRDHFSARFADVPLAAIGPSDLLDARREIEAGHKPRTVSSYMGTLHLIFRDAEIAGHITHSPFASGLPQNRTKRGRAGNRKRVTFRPFIADELAILLDVLRAPRNAKEAMLFPLSEYLLLTGLRYGEGAALDWSRVSWIGRIIHVDQATVRGESKAEPTKTGGAWTIELRPALLDLLERQRVRSGGHGQVFPGIHANSYWSWRKIGWLGALERAKVAPREGDAQKACRRSYITSSLICGRNPKQVSAEVGHTTVRMVIEQYDSFIDPSRWPDPSEIRKVAELYGWPITDPNGRLVWLPRGYPAATQHDLEDNDGGRNAH